jgi:hypothetical protein
LSLSAGFIAVGKRKKVFIELLVKAWAWTVGGGEAASTGKMVKGLWIFLEEIITLAVFQGLSRPAGRSLVVVACSMGIG